LCFFRYTLWPVVSDSNKKLIILFYFRDVIKRRTLYYNSMSLFSYSQLIGQIYRMLKIICLLLLYEIINFFFPYFSNLCRTFPCVVVVVFFCGACKDVERLDWLCQRLKARLSCTQLYMRGWCNLDLQVCKNMITRILFFNFIVHSCNSKYLLPMKWFLWYIAVGWIV